MIVVDPSALLTLFFRQDGHEAIARIIDDAETALLSVASRIRIVSMLCGPEIGADPLRVGDFVDGLNLDLAPVTAEHMSAALLCLLTYGRGRHAAALEFEDCFSYALAKVAGARLLFTESGFGLTDIRPAGREDATDPVGETIAV